MIWAGGTAPTFGKTKGVAVNEADLAEWSPYGFVAVSRTGGVSR